jgi:hypothetical protein
MIIEGYGSNIEVFSTREAAEARKQAYRDREVVDNNDPTFVYDYDYDLLKIVKRKVG